MNHIITFATKDYELEQQRLKNQITSLMPEINQIHYSEENFCKTNFYLKHRNRFRQSRGFGLWLWKPYIIYEEICKLDNGDIIFYIDSGCSLISSLKPLFDLVQKNSKGTLFFDCRPLKNLQWVSNITKMKMNCDMKYDDSYHVIATCFAIIKNSFTVKLMEEWLFYCLDYEALSGKKYGFDSKQSDQFIEHREDQSILSMLIAKYGIETYRNPSKWGNYLKMEEYRIEGEYNGYPYALVSECSGYSNEAQFNSPYPTIFEFNSRIIKEENDKSLFKKIKSSFRILVKR